MGKTNKRLILKTKKNKRTKKKKQTESNFTTIKREKTLFIFFIYINWIKSIISWVIKNVKREMKNEMKEPKMKQQIRSINCLIFCISERVNRLYNDRKKNT